MEKIELNGHWYVADEMTESAILVKRDGLFFAAVCKATSGSISVLRDEQSNNGERKFKKVLDLNNLFSCLESNPHLMVKIIKCIAK